MPHRNIPYRALFLCVCVPLFSQCAVETGKSGAPVTPSPSIEPNAGVAPAGSGVSLAAGLTYTGMCDGSAAAALDEQTFVVASDEATFKQGTTPQKNLLGIYRLAQGGAPVQTVDLTATLAPEPNNPAQHDPEHVEADLESAARIGNRIYWLTSHGHNSSGKRRVDRYRFFATDVVGSGANITVRLAGTSGAFPAYMNLLKDMSGDARLAPFKLGDLDAAQVAPEAGGINIEGLSATRDNKLLIAFRSPVPQGKALLVPLENADELIEGRAAQAKFGAPVQLDLGGRGVRDIAYWPQRNSYIIIAGPAGPTGEFRLYQWSGAQTQAPVVIKDKAGNELSLAGLAPEALVIYPTTNRLLLLSDDGDVQLKSASNNELKANKELPDAERRFRTAWLMFP